MLVLVVGLVATLVVVTRGDDDRGPAATDGSDSATTDTGPPAPDQPDTEAPEPEPDTDEVIAEDRQAALDAATAFITTINTYGPADLDADDTMPRYRARVTTLLTDEFEAQFADAAGVIEQTVAEQDYARTIEVVGAGVARLGDDEATALVAATFSGSFADAAPTLTPARQRVSLERVDGEWLVADFGPVGSASDDVAGAPDDRAETGVADARAAAVAAAPVVLGYDYRTLAADLDAARALMTDSYRREYDAAAGLLREQVPQQQIVVRGTVLDSGVRSVGPDTVEVLLFLDRRTTRRQGAPQVSRDQATATMRLVDGTWLLDGLATSAG